MMDHDQRFKTLIQEFFDAFLRLFFQVWAGRLDATTVEWLDKEVFLDPPQGGRRGSTWWPRCPPARACQANGRAKPNAGWP